MAGSVADLRIDVRPADNVGSYFLWTVYVAEEVIKTGTARTRKEAHQLAHNASTEWREQNESVGHGHKKTKKDE